jgi:hypothetical protein
MAWSLVGESLASVRIVGRIQFLVRSSVEGVSIPPKVVPDVTERRTQTLSRFNIMKPRDLGIVSLVGFLKNPDTVVFFASIAV